MEMEAFSLTPNISANSLSFIKSSNQGQFRNQLVQPLLLDLIKFWLRYWGLKKRVPFQNHPVFYDGACINHGIIAWLLRTNEY